MADFDININTYLLVTQTGHGFTVGQAVRRVFGGTSYALAIADSIVRARVSGVVAEVVNANSFRLALPGHRIAGLSGLTDGSTYFISDVTGGLLTTTAPAIAVPVMVATSATTGIIVDSTTAAQSEGRYVKDGDTLATGLTFPNTGLKVDDIVGDHSLAIVVNEDLSDNRRLGIDVVDGDRLLSIQQDTVLAGGTHSGTNTGDQDLSGLQPLDSDLTTIAGLTPSNDDIIQRKAGVWTNRTMAQLATDLASGIRSTVLTGLSTASSAAVAATDTILEAFGKLQAFNNLFTTVGLAIARLTNPSAVTFLRMNADNTATARTASEMRTDLGLGTAATVNTGTGSSDVPTITQADARYLLASNETITLLGSTQTTTSTSLVDCTGLSASVEANATYQIEGFMLFQSTALTNGISLSLNGPSSPTEFAANFQVPLSGTGTGNIIITAYDATANTSNIGATNTSYFALLNGKLVNGTNAGTLIVRFASEVGTQTVRIMAGSSLRLRKIS